MVILSDSPHHDQWTHKWTFYHITSQHTRGSHPYPCMKGRAKKISSDFLDAKNKKEHTCCKDTPVQQLPRAQEACSQEHVSTTTPTQLLEQDAPTTAVAPLLYYICIYHLLETICRILAPLLHMLPALYHTVIYRNCSDWRITPPYSKKPVWFITKSLFRLKTVHGQMCRTLE